MIDTCDVAITAFPLQVVEDKRRRHDLPYRNRYDYDYTFRRPEQLSVDGLDHGIRHGFLRARANSIEGGTSEIMKNILGEQVLGLPGEPRVDKDLPWTKVPRN